MSIKKGELIRFNHLRINRNAERDCTCAEARFELDIANRRVTCMECNAILDHFEALVKFASNHEVLNDLAERRRDQQMALQKELQYLEDQIQVLRKDRDDLKNQSQRR